MTRVIENGVGLRIEGRPLVTHRGNSEGPLPGRMRVANLSAHP